MWPNYVMNINVVSGCGNYRGGGVKLMSHTMKILERIIERRLREETTIGDGTIWFHAR